MNIKSTPYSSPQRRVHKRLTDSLYAIIQLFVISNAVYIAIVQQHLYHPLNLGYTVYQWSFTEIITTQVKHNTPKPSHLKISWNPECLLSQPNHTIVVIMAFLATWGVSSPPLPPWVGILRRPKNTILEPKHPWSTPRSNATCHV